MKNEQYIDTILKILIFDDKKSFFNFIEDTHIKIFLPELPQGNFFWCDNVYNTVIDIIIEIFIDDKYVIDIKKYYGSIREVHMLCSSNYRFQSTIIKENKTIPFNFADINEQYENILNDTQRVWKFRVTIGTKPIKNYIILYRDENKELLESLENAKIELIKQKKEIYFEEDKMYTHKHTISNEFVLSI